MGNVRRRTLIGFGALLALGVVLVSRHLYWCSYRQSWQRRDPGRRSNHRAASLPHDVTVRVSGTKGQRSPMPGIIWPSERGQKSNDGTLGTTPDDHELPLSTGPGSMGGLTAEVVKNLVGCTRLRYTQAATISKR